MRITFSTLFLIGALALTGCGVNPKLNQKLDNQQGKIDEIKNNQNGLNLELMKLRQNAEISNSELKEVQQGLFNLNAAISKNENSGIQILQGDGALVLIFGIAVIGMLLVYYYWDKSKKSEKAAEILASEVASYDNAGLNEGILRSAMHTEVESQVFNLLKKYQPKYPN